MAEGDPRTPGHTITVLLHRARQGDHSALDQVFRATYQELRQLAFGTLARSQRRRAFEITALIGAACERLLGREQLDAENRRHFFFLLGRAMHDVIVDEARRRDRLKRGGGQQPVPLVEWTSNGVQHGIMAIEFEDSMSALRGRDPLAAQVVELRLFGGQTLEQVAEFMGISFAVTRGHWEYGKAWLRSHLEER